MNTKVDNKGMGFGLNAAKMADELQACEFFNDYLRLYSAHSNVRGIPFIGDGFKEAQRKAVWGMLSRGEQAGLISVERVGSHCAAVTDYHHGVGSMQGTIVGLAQDFAGSNNVNFLEPEGSFGSRRSHGAAAPRYIETKLHANFRAIFKRDDDVILEQKKVGDFKIEPKYFIPLLPVVLLNGAEGMGTGHATHIFQYSVKDLKDAILKELDGKPLPDHTLVPSWKDFKGTVTRNKTSGQVTVVGDFKTVNSTEIRVTELPVGMQSDKYEELLFKLEDKGVVRRFKNASDDNGFEFILSVPRTTTYEPREELLKVLKLVSNDTENLTLWGIDGFITKYRSVEHVVSDFVKWRLARYEERRKKQIEITEAEILWLNEAMRFILFYLSNVGLFKDTGKQDLLNLLVKEKFSDPDRLLSMPIWSLTKDRIAELAKKLETEEAKLAAYQKDTADKLYRRELAALKLE